MDKALFTLDLADDKQRAYLYDNDGKLIKFGNLIELNPSVENIDITGRNGIVLKRIAKKSVNPEIEEATNEEMLREIDRQMNLREDIKTTLTEKINNQNERLLNLLKVIANSDKDIVSILDEFDYKLSDEFNNRFRYCNNCKEFTDVKMYEDEVYVPEYDDYCLRPFYRCEKCSEYY